jgi:hypothetical protein
VGIGDYDRDSVRGVVAEVVAQLVADLMRRGRVRQHTVIGHAPPDAQERGTQQHQQRNDGQSDRNRAAHHELG